MKESLPLNQNPAFMLNYARGYQFIDFFLSLYLLPLDGGASFPLLPDACLLAIYTWLIALAKNVAIWTQFTVCRISTLTSNEILTDNYVGVIKK